VWLRGNKNFVPDSKPRNSIYVWRYVALASGTGAGEGFHIQSIFEPGEPQCVNACGFLLSSVMWEHVISK
jgi:hypothetical protein